MNPTCLLLVLNSNFRSSSNVSGSRSSHNLSSLVYFYTKLIFGAQLHGVLRFLISGGLEILGTLVVINIKRALRSLTWGPDGLHSGVPEVNHTGGSCSPISGALRSLLGVPEVPHLGYRVSEVPYLGYRVHEVLHLGPLRSLTHGV